MKLLNLPPINHDQSGDISVQQPFCKIVTSQISFSATVAFADVNNLCFCFFHCSQAGEVTKVKLVQASSS